MNKELVSNFCFQVDAFRMTRNGGAKLTLSIPESEISQALAMAVQGQKLSLVYNGDFFVVKEEIIGGKRAE